VLAEGRRLLRPGTGRLVVVDGDYASLTLATDAPEGGEATDRAVQRGIIAQPRVMRAMPRLLAEPGCPWPGRGPTLSPTSGVPTTAPR